MIDMETTLYACLISPKVGSLPDEAKALYVAMLARIGEGGERTRSHWETDQEIACFDSLDTFAKQNNRSPEDVQLALKLLIKKGLVKQIEDRFILAAVVDGTFQWFYESSSSIQKNPKLRQRPSTKKTELLPFFLETFKENFGYNSPDLPVSAVARKATQSSLLSLLGIFETAEATKGYLEFAIENWKRINDTTWLNAPEPTLKLLVNPSIIGTVRGIMEKGFSSGGSHDRAGQKDWNSQQDGW